MAEKRYYWLKLKSTYFKQLNQVKMRRQKHGKDMQIIYLKLMLHSLDSNGEIYYEGVFGSLAEEIALKIDEENTDIVQETIDYLKENGMITVLSNDPESIAIPETLECTGSEAYSTERSRRCRDKKRCNATDLQQSATKCSALQLREREREREDKDIEKREKIGTKSQRFITPTLEEVEAYCKERNNVVDAKAFIDFYESKGWMVGKNKMKDWKAAVRTWERREQKPKPGQTKKPQYKQYIQREVSDAERDDLERKLLQNSSNVAPVQQKGAEDD